MTTLAEQIRKYINIIEAAVRGENTALKYCYIDMSSATDAGMTAIRIFPKEGEDKFFEDVARDLEARLSDIEEIIEEAKANNDKIRIAISREADFTKQLTQYIPCDSDNSIIIKNIIDKGRFLADKIKK